LIEKKEKERQELCRYLLYTTDGEKGANSHPPQEEKGDLLPATRRKKTLPTFNSQKKVEARGEKRVFPEFREFVL